MNSFSEHPMSANWSKNNDKLPHEVHISSKKSYLFDCPDCGHEFLKSLYEISVRNRGCQYCIGRAMCDNKDCEMCFNQSFASIEESKYWSKKNKKEPRQVSKGSGQEFSFDCPDCGHEFAKRLCAISGKKKEWCPYCKGNNKLCVEECKFCFNRSFASHEKSNQWGKGNTVSPRNVFKNSSVKYYFDCNACKHTFDAQPSKISYSGSWCPYCADMILCNGSECLVCFNKSFASHLRAKEWNYEKNDCKPRDVFKGSEIIIYFDCNKCEHTFSAKLCEVNRGQWCPYCANSSLCSESECLTCFNKSFAAHPRANSWINEKNDCKPRDVFCGTDGKYFLRCDVCNHELYISLKRISRDNVMCGENCAYCHSKKLCENEECISCFDKSFESFPKINQLISTESGEKPRQIFKFSGQHCTFECDVCQYVFTNTVSHISGGQFCPTCKNKTEGKLRIVLVKRYPEVKIQQKYDWCMGTKKRHYPFDFVIELLKLIIELDGDQHFRNITLFKGTHEERRERDVFKMWCANENGYRVIRLLQMDVHQDKNNWEELLFEAIGRVERGEVLNQYISNTDIYKKHIEDLELLKLTSNGNIIDVEDNEENIEDTEKVKIIKKDGNTKKATTIKNTEKAKNTEKSKNNEKEIRNEKVKNTGNMVTEDTKKSGNTKSINIGETENTNEEAKTKKTNVTKETKNITKINNTNEDKKANIVTSEKNTNKVNKDQIVKRMGSVIIVKDPEGTNIKKKKQVVKYKKVEKK